MIQTSIQKESQLSYFLLGKKIYFILNANAKSGNVSKMIRSLSKNFPLYSFNVVLSSAVNMVMDLAREIGSEDLLFIVLGGDGTVHNAVQYLTKTNACFGIIPKGTANDLASYFGIPKNTRKALQIISEGHRTSIDTIKVNGNHILTVGSVGFPAYVAQTVNRFKSKGLLFKWLHRYVLRSSIYLVFVVLIVAWKRSAAFNFSGQVEADGSTVYRGRFVAVFFGKQEFLGKTFRPCPGVKHSDPYFGLSVLAYDGFWQALKDIFWISRGNPQRAKNLKTFKANEMQIKVDGFAHLLSDGEVLDWDDEFVGKRISKALKIIVPKAFDERPA